MTKRDWDDLPGSPEEQSNWRCESSRAKLRRNGT